MNHPNSYSNSNSISAYLTGGNSNTNTNSNNTQVNKISLKEKQQNISNAKSNNTSIVSQQTFSEMEKKLLNYIPSLIHDLRNPLQQLYACIELYKQQLNQMQNPLYEILSHSVTHMNELITKALTTFKNITERKSDDQICDLQYQNIDISMYLEEFWTNNLAIAEQKPNVDYQILVQSTLPHYVNIPKLEVTQVIQNLFSNATKFTEKGSIKMIVSFHEISDDDDKDFSICTQENNNFTQGNIKDLNQSHRYSANQGLYNSCNLKNSKGQEIDLDNSSNSIHKTHLFKQKDLMNKAAYDGGKESSPVEQDISIAMDGSQKLHQQQYPLIQESQTPSSVRQSTLSLGNRVFGAHTASQIAHPQFNSATTIPTISGREVGSHKLQKKLQSITYQFDKLKYSQQQDNDYQMNTEEDVDEDYTESESNEPCAHLPPSQSTQIKPLDGYSEYYQNTNNLNTSNTNNYQMMQSSSGQQKKTLLSQYSLSSQTHLNTQITPQQANGATPKNQINNGGNLDSTTNNHILSFNQIENSYTSSTSRSCHNSTPPTFQVHTFSDIQNLKNTNFQQQNLIKSQQLSSSSRQTPGEGSLPTNNYSTQYHTPQMNPKNDLHSSKYQCFNNSDQPHNSSNIKSSRKGQITHSSSQKSINQQLGKEIGSKNFLTEFPSPDAVSINSQSKAGGAQGRNNINSFSSDMNYETKNIGSNEEVPMKHSIYLNKSQLSTQCNMQNNMQPGSADLEVQKKSMKLSAMIQQQEQNKMMVQSSISNSYYYNCQQKQISQSSGDLRSLKKLQYIGPIYNPVQNTYEITEKIQPDVNKIQQSEDQINYPESNHCNYSKILAHQNLSSEKLPNNNEFCQIFSKRKSQIHPSIRDLVFSRNNIRNYQIRRIAQIKGYLKFEILDTGKGMDANEQKKIFNIYQQANNSIKENYGGSGIGLYSAKNIANQLKGDIYCHSQKGVGSAFIFYMPCNATYKTEVSQDSKDQIKSQFSKNYNSQQQSTKIQKEQMKDYYQNVKQHNFNRPLLQSEQNAQQDSINPSSAAVKINQGKQQQLQIMQIKQGLKSADSFNQKLEQQNKLVVIKKQDNSNTSPSDQKEQELQKLILQLEGKKKKIRLIYIDDTPFLLQTMENLLSKIKCIELTVEKSPLKCLQTIKSNPKRFDVALIDHVMPELNGKVLAQKIKEINPNITLVCHSGYDATDQFQEECIESGFSYLLQKPCFLENIVILLSQIYQIDYSHLKQINTSFQQYKLQSKN